MLPLFPLPVVLFPGTLLPLHIFEPRYRVLLADCVEGDHRFGILPPGPDQEPSPESIGTIARIRAIQPLPDGRSHIVVSGETRFLLKRTVPTEKPYLVGEVDPVEDRPDVQVPSGAEVSALKRLGERYAAALGTMEDTEREPELSDEPGALSFQIAALLEWEYPVKQHFLTLQSAMERVTRLLHAVPKLLDGIEARALVHRRAASNGTGHR